MLEPAGAVGGVLLVRAGVEALRRLQWLPPRRLRRVRGRPREVVGGALLEDAETGELSSLLAGSAAEAQ